MYDQNNIFAKIIKNEISCDKIFEDDTFNFTDLSTFSKGKQLTLEVVHADETIDPIMLNHTYNDTQIDWFRPGSALNLIREQNNNWMYKIIFSTENTLVNIL